MKYQWSNQDYQYLLNQQLKLLSNSCKLFDRGDYDEYVRIAVIVRVLLHDTNNSTSLLNQLNIKNSIDYLSIYRDDKNRYSLVNNTTKVDNEKGIEECEFVNANRLIRAIKNSEFNMNHSNFTNWWNEEIIIKFNSKKWNRKDLILAVSNKLGGAHIDDSPDLDLIELSSKKNIILETIRISKSNTITRPINSDVMAASIRKIGYELLESLAIYNNAS